MVLSSSFWVVLLATLGRERGVDAVLSDDDVEGLLPGVAVVGMVHVEGVPIFAVLALAMLGAG